MCGKETGKEKNPKTREERLYRFCNKCIGGVAKELECVKSLIDALRQYC